MSRAATAEGCEWRMAREWFRPGRNWLGAGARRVLGEGGEGVADFRARAGLIRFYFGAVWLARQQPVPVGMLHRWQEGQLEVRGCSVPGVQRGHWRTEQGRGGQTTATPPAPSLCAGT